MNEQLENALEIVSKNPNIYDGIQLASELGRLDIVSLILGIIALLLAILAFCGFWMIRRAAINAAKNAARDAARDAAIKEINTLAPQMFKEGSKLQKNDEQVLNVDLPHNIRQDASADAVEMTRDE